MRDADGGKDGGIGRRLWGQDQMGVSPDRLLRDSMRQQAAGPYGPACRPAGFCSLGEEEWVLAPYRPGC